LASYTWCREGVTLKDRRRGEMLTGEASPSIYAETSVGRLVRIPAQVANRISPSCGSGEVCVSAGKN
jgi:hypothetical protein